MLAVVQSIYPAYSPFMLRNELVLDPLHLGYSGFLAASDFIGVANLLGQVGVGSGYTVYRNDIHPGEVVNAIQPADFARLSVQQAQMLQLLFTPGVIDATLSGVRQNFGIVFSGASGTVNALSALATRQGSRAEVLFGDGVSVSDAEVRFALSLASGLSG